MGITAGAFRNPKGTSGISAGLQEGRYIYAFIRIDRNAHQKKPDDGGIEETMGRREQREQIFKLLFRVEFNQKEEMPEQCELFFEDEENGIPEKDIAYIRGKFDKIQEKIPVIDEMINTTAKGWTTSRMGKVDLTIIRLAVYEIKFDEEVPDSVAINEAVELAKKFGQDESAGFINGVLARFV